MCCIRGMTLSLTSIFVMAVTTMRVEHCMANYIPRGMDARSTNTDNLPSSCNEIRRQDASLGNGMYYIKDIEGNIFQTYCDMTVAGGGWTLVASIHENIMDGGRCATGDRWSGEHGNNPKHPHGDGFWENRATHGTASSAASDDYKNPAYFNMNARDIMIWHVENDSPMTHFDFKAFLKYHTTNGFLSYFGGNLGSMFSNHYKMRSGEYRTNTDNGPAFPITWDVGSNDAMLSLIGPDLRNYVDPGFVQFRVINNERSAFALCSGIRVKSNLGDVEHVCIGSTSNHGSFPELCGDFAGLDYDHKPGHSASEKLINSVVMIFYK